MTTELQATRTFSDDTLTAAAAIARNAEASEKAGEETLAQAYASTAAELGDKATRAADVIGQLEVIQGGYDAWQATEGPTLDRGTVAKTALQRRGVAADYGVPPAPEPLTGQHLTRHRKTPR